MYMPKPDSIKQEEWDSAWAEWGVAVEKLHRMRYNVIKELGYDRTDFSHQGPFKSADGNVYETYNDFRSGHGYYPYWIKDGIWYGLYEIFKIYHLDTMKPKISDKTRELILI